MGNSPYGTLVLIVVMVVAFYFLILRPQRKRQQKQQQTVNTLVPGTRVVTGSGFYGTLVEVGDKQVVMEISPGAQLTVLKQAISRVVAPGEEDADAPAVTDAAYAADGSTDVVTEDDAYPAQASHDFRTSYQKPADESVIEPADERIEGVGETSDRPRDNS